MTVRCDSLVFSLTGLAASGNNTGNMGAMSIIVVIILSVVYDIYKCLQSGSRHRKIRMPADSGIKNGNTDSFSCQLQTAGGIKVDKRCNTLHRIPPDLKNCRL